MKKPLCLRSQPASFGKSVLAPLRRLIEYWAQARESRETAAVTAILANLRVSPNHTVKRLARLARLIAFVESIGPLIPKNRLASGNLELVAAREAGLTLKEAG